MDVLRPEWIAIAVLSVILVSYLAYLCLRRSRKTAEDLIVESGRCCYCLKQGTESFYCEACFRRLILRFAAILAGILCVPGGAAAGYLVHVAARTPLGESVFFGAFACVVVYNVLVWSYIFIFVRERVHWRLSFFGFVFGFDPRGINISPGREWWRFKLLLKQALGAKER